MPELLYEAPPVQRRTLYAYDDFNNGAIFRLVYGKDDDAPLAVELRGDDPLLMVRR